MGGIPDRSQLTLLRAGGHRPVEGTTQLGRRLIVGEKYSKREATTLAVLRGCQQCQRRRECHSVSRAHWRFRLAREEEHGKTLALRRTSGRRQRCTRSRESTQVQASLCEAFLRERSGDGMRLSLSKELAGLGESFIAGGLNHDVVVADRAICYYW